MDKLIEVVRRLLLAITWAIGGFAIFMSLLGFYELPSDRLDEAVYVALGAVIGTFVLTKLVNWIFLKSE